MHNDARLAFWATMGLGGGPVLFYRGFKGMRTRRLIADTPTARIRSMAMGLVEVNGAVELRSWVNAPFSGKTCAYWEIDISTPVPNSWDVLYRDQSGSPFFLRDEDAVALVYPRGATCKIPFGMEEVCAGPNLPPPTTSTCVPTRRQSAGSTVSVACASASARLTWARRFTYSAPPCRARRSG